MLNTCMHRTKHFQKLGCLFCQIWLVQKMQRKSIHKFASAALVWCVCAHAYAYCVSECIQLPLLLHHWFCRHAMHTHTSAITPSSMNRYRIRNFRYVQILYGHTKCRTWNNPLLNARWFLHFNRWHLVVERTFYVMFKLYGVSRIWNLALQTTNFA